MSQLATTGGKLIVKDGKLCLTCCGSENIPCPTDCSSCPSTISCHIQWSGSDCNGETVTLTRSGCEWSWTDGDCVVDLSCINGTSGSWQVEVLNGDGTNAESDNMPAIMPNCPPLGTYNQNGIGIPLVTLS